MLEMLLNRVIKKELGLAESTIMIREDNIVYEERGRALTCPSSASTCPSG